MPAVRPSLSFQRPPPAVLALLVTWAVGFVGFAIAARTGPGGAVYEALLLRTDAVLDFERPWSVLTYALVHPLSSFWAPFFSGLMTYLFGPELERRWGTPRFVLFVVATVVAGASAMCVDRAIGLSSASAMAIGPAAFVHGLIVAWGLTFPRREVMLFGLVPLKGIHFVWLSVAIALLDTIGINAVPVSLHFGGMGMAAALVLGLWRRNAVRLAWDWLLVKLRMRKPPKLYVVPPPKSKYDIQ